MKSCTRTYLAVLAAVAAIPAFVTTVSAQNRIDTSGHALDANTQVGSGGYNVQNNTTAAYQTYQNAITTGNVGNGYQFRGSTINGVNLGTGIADPFAFRGLLPGQGVDQFIANSTGVPTMANPSASSQNFAAPVGQSLTYYGSASHGAPPPGYTPGPTNNNFIPSQPFVQSPQDTRLGAVDYSGANNGVQIVPKPNELLLPGPVDTSANPATQAQQMLAASPLYGMRPWDTSQNTQIAGQTLAAWQPGVNQTPLQQGFAPNLPTTLNQSRITQIQQQLLSENPNWQGNNTQIATGQNQNQNSNNAAGSNSSNSSALGSGQLPALTPGGQGSTFDQSIPSGTLGSSALSSGNLTSQPGNFSSGQSNRQYLTAAQLPAPGKQSALYAQLQQKMQEYNSAHNLSDEQANAKFKEILHLRNMIAASAEKGGNIFTSPTPTQAGAPGVNPGAVPNPEQPLTPGVNQGLHAVPPASNSQHDINSNFTALPNNIAGMNFSAAAPPVPIESYASGIKVKDLADLIASGESQMQKQHYDKAIATFNEAFAADSNNPLILMARANAELGGGYYAQANADIHLAVAQDPATLMGQYDLQKHLGADRLKSLISDLKEMAQSSHDDTLHSFLLAYVYYNSHHVGQAADWVAITDNRANGQDAALVQMKKYWNFNEDQQPGATTPARPATVTPATRPSKPK